EKGEAFMLQRLCSSLVRTLSVFVLLVTLIYGGDAFAQTCVPFLPGIIAHWTLDETSSNLAQDVIGNHTGAYANGPMPTIGKVRGALRFNGTNSYVAVQDSDIWTFVRDFTIEFWTNFGSPGGGTVGHPSHIFIGNDEG